MQGLRHADTCVGDRLDSAWRYPLRPLHLETLCVAPEVDRRRVLERTSAVSTVAVFTGKAGDCSPLLGSFHCGRSAVGSPINVAALESKKLYLVIVSMRLRAVGAFCTQ